MRISPHAFLCAAALAAASRLAADEGMWMPQQVPALAAKLRALGFAGDGRALAELGESPLGAVVSLGGCTGSFVSPDGLILTNHHCVASALQYNTTPQRDLLAQGFLAKTREEELWSGPGSKAWLTVSITDVTDAIAGGVEPKLDDLKRQQLLERRVRERTAACEAGGLHCRVAPVFEGLQYLELAQLEIADLRLAYAPAAGIGDFGGEADNWRWPRHTGDWGVYRAYVGPDGKPAPHAASNVPYRPDRWLKLQPSGVKEGEPVVVVGYPGRTTRLATYGEVKDMADWTLPHAIRAAQEQLEILGALGRQDAALALKAARRVAGLNNSLTNRRGMLDGLQRGGLAEKQRREEHFAAWIAADPARQKEWGDVLPALAALQAEGRTGRERDFVLAQLRAASPLLDAAETAARLALEREKPDPERELGFQERDFARLREAQERAQRSLDTRLDRALLRYWLRRAAALPGDARLQGVDKLAGFTPGMAEADSDSAIDAYLDRLLAGTKLADKDARLGLLDKPRSELLATRDSVLDLALALEPLERQLREEARRRQGTAARLRPRYAKALLAEAGGLVAPDANSTLRVSIGSVRARANATDGVDWRAFTTLAGVEQKHTGEGEFNAPEAELAAIRALRAGKASRYVAPELGDVPVDFLSTADTTGGNSGSPTLDSKGDLVGLLFDGTFDTVASDVVYDEARTRSIHVDVRYLLWVMSEIDGAGGLLEEMGVR